MTLTKKLTITFVLITMVVATSCMIIKKQNMANSNRSINYYELCDFDFIIPNPWYTQISEIAAMKFTDEIVPYYITEKKLFLEKKSVTIDLYIIETDAKLTTTAFSPSLMLSGSILGKDKIVIDEKTANLLGASVGDKVALEFESEFIEFQISGIARRNKFSSYPTAVVFNEGKIKNYLAKIEMLSYTGAYVSVNDIEAASEYFKSSYKAMGKVGKRDWYSDDESYNFMKKSIENTNFEKEIVNVAGLR